MWSVLWRCPRARPDHGAGQIPRPPGLRLGRRPVGPIIPPRLRKKGRSDAFHNRQRFLPSLVTWEAVIEQPAPHCASAGGAGPLRPVEDRLVERVIEKIVEVPVEYPVERVVEKIVEVSCGAAPQFATLFATQPTPLVLPGGGHFFPPSHFFEFGNQCGCPGNVL